MRKIFLLFVTLFLLLLFGCRKPPSDQGLIVTEMDFGTCIIPSMLPREEYVIDDSSSYRQLQVENKCSSYTFPFIDFSQHTLLGKFASGKCKVKFYREVLKNDQSKTYNYTVYIRDKGWCKAEAQNMNWVLVPKLPQGYTVVFHINKK